jgi:putative FmdB family regulatory protein
MPTYEYRCRDCGQSLEAVQAFTDDALTVCPNCSGSLRKVFGNIGVTFKGTGFYKNDHGARAKTNGSSGESKSDSSSGDTKSDSSKSDSSKSESTKSDSSKSESTKSDSTTKSDSSKAASPSGSSSSSG